MKTGTDFKFIEKVLGNECWAALRRRGYSIVVDGRSGLFGAYYGVYYNGFLATGRRTGVTQLPGSRVQLRDNEDHERVVRHVYNAIQSDAAAGDVATDEDPLPMLDLSDAGASGEDHGRKSDTSDADAAASDSECEAH